MLGPDVAIDIEVIDETNTRVDVPALLSRFGRHNGFGCIALIGVQSNQYPRALDIARPLPGSRNCGGHGRFPRVRVSVDAGWPRRYRPRVSQSRLSPRLWPD